MPTRAGRGAVRRVQSLRVMQTEASLATSLGLTAAEAAQRLATIGRNEIARRAATSPWRILAGQFKSPLIWLLLAASVLSGVLGEVVDAIAIGAILILNALVGFFQEYRAEAAMRALQAMTAPRARVVRDGRMVEIAAAEVVPGRSPGARGGRHRRRRRAPRSRRTRCPRTRRR